MNSIVSFSLCTLTDEDLLKKVDEKTDEMYKTLDIPVRHIPVRPNEDYDLLVGELVYRYNKLIKKKDTTNSLQQQVQS